MVNRNYNKTKKAKQNKPFEWEWAMGMNESVRISRGEQWEMKCESGAFAHTANYLLRSRPINFVPNNRYMYVEFEFELWRTIRHT